MVGEVQTLWTPPAMALSERATRRLRRPWRAVTRCSDARGPRRDASREGDLLAGREIFLSRSPEVFPANIPSRIRSRRVEPSKTRPRLSVGRSLISICYPCDTIITVAVRDEFRIIFVKRAPQLHELFRPGARRNRCVRWRLSVVLSIWFTRVKTKKKK